MTIWLSCSILAASLTGSAAHAHVPGLPEVMRLNDGTPVNTPETWAVRREEMKEIVLTHEYGHLPPVPKIRVEGLVSEEVTVQGLAEPTTRLRAVLVFGPEDGLRMDVGCWLPSDRQGPVPVVLGIEPVWWPDPFLRRGIIRRLLANGYGFAGFDHNALASYEEPDKRAARDAYPEYGWGVVAVAAWGCSVTLNWLETLPGVDAAKVAVWGHSRRGKSALLAGALDTRFAAVLPHMSGMAGSALYGVRGRGAQELEQLLERFWLTPKAFEYIDREEELPFDQHWLLALVAPRPAYLHVGRGDHWGNPFGEQAAFDAAQPIYAWLGQPQRLGIYFVDADHVDPNGPEGGESWETVIDFLNQQLLGEAGTRDFGGSLQGGTPPGETD